MALALLLAFCMPILAMIRPPLVHSSLAIRPNVVENGTDVVGIPFPADVPNGTLLSLTFGPDGTAYFVDAPGEIASVSPTGVYTKIPAPRVVYSGAILYAHGSLWTGAREGIVRVAASGSNSRWYRLNQGEAKFGITGYDSIIDGPNGSVLFVGELVNAKMGTQSGEIVSIDLHGKATVTTIPGQPQGPLVFDSSGRLYFSHTPPAGALGIARLEPNGSVTTIPFPYPQYTLRQVSSMVNVHGTLYFASFAYIATPQNGERFTGFFGTIPQNGPIAQSLGPLVFDSSGRLYFSYTPPAGALGIARLEPNGSVTTIPFPYPQYTLRQVSSMVNVHGTLYFASLISAYIATPQNGERFTGFFGTIPQNGPIAQIVLPGGRRYGTYVFQPMAADFGGNLWMSLYTGPGYLLYGYDTYNGKYSAAIEPSLIDRLYAGPYIGPDDNMWTVRYDTDPHHYYQPNGFDVYVKHVQTLEPAGLALVPGQTSVFSILETHFNGPWTAKSLNPAIATVSPESAVNGVFTVLGIGHGTTRIQVKDHLGNVSYETIAIGRRQLKCLCIAFSMRFNLYARAGSQHRGGRP